jgi:hypothetical protein
MVHDDDDKGKRCLTLETKRIALWWSVVIILTSENGILCVLCGKWQSAMCV